MSSVAPCASTDRLRIVETQSLSESWYPLRRYRLEYRRFDGSWQCIEREVLHRGDSVAILLWNVDRGTVVMTRQLRLPARLGGHRDGFLLEAAGGRVGHRSPEDAARAEAEEETGFRPRGVELVCIVYLSPHVVSECSHLFLAEVTERDRVAGGGGIRDEGEDVEVCEMSFRDALVEVSRGGIADGKTILLLNHLRAVEARAKNGVTP